jgi:hypothetical protein
MNELHVVALSGGKDSTAMALRLAEVEPRDYVYVVTPTGNELPDMFRHWKHLAELLGKPLTPVLGGTLTKIIREQAMIPNFRARFCTRMLKIEPYAAWLLRQKETYDSVVSYVGLRADEEGREGGDYTALPGVVSDFPLRRWGWGLSEVMAYVKSKGVAIPRRTDCALCFFQRLIEWWRLWRDNPAAYAHGEQLEAEIGYTFRSDARDSWPAGLKELRAEFEKGRIPRKNDLQGDLFAQLQCRVCRI